MGAGRRPAALARVLSIAAPRLQPDEAAALADAADRAAPLAPDAFARAGLADLLAALVPTLPPDRKATAMALARVDLAADNLNGEWVHPDGALQSGVKA